MNARVVSVLFAFLFSAGVSHAEVMPTQPEIPAMRLDVPSLLAAHNARYRAVVIRDAGIATTVVGAVATVAGAVLFLKSLCMNDISGSCPDGHGAIMIGASTLLGVGQVAVATGITLWAFGGHNKDDAERKIVSLSATGAALRF